MIYNSDTNYINDDGSLNIEAVTAKVSEIMDSDPTRQQIRLPIDSTSLAVLRKSLGVVNNLTPTGGIELGTNSLVNGIVSGYIKSRNYVAGSAGWSIKEDGTAEFSSATIRGYVNATSGLIGGWIINATSISDVAGTVGLSSAVTGGDDIRFWAGSATPASAPFKVTEAGALTANSGTIGGFTLGATEMYGGIIKTAATVGIGSTGVIMDTAGLRGYDSVLGNTFNLPTNGSAPTFSSGIINSTIFNINTSAVLRTSATVGDGSASSAGILINDTGIYGCAANQTTTTANIRILNDGGGTITLGTSSFIRGGQTDFATGTGFFLGTSGGDEKFSVGDSTNYLTFDGTYLRLKGSFDVGSGGVINNSSYTVANLPVTPTEVGWDNPSGIE